MLSSVFLITDWSLFEALLVGWLWLTVLFANVAEAVAEGRGKAQAESLRRARKETTARRLARGRDRGDRFRPPGSVPGDRCLVVAGEVIPGDGEVVEGVAAVDESAITGESAPVIREAGGDRSSVTGGTRVLSDRIVVRITSRPGETFLDRMIALVEGAVAPEDPQRGGPQHPARRPHHRVPARRGHPAALGRLLRGPPRTMPVLVALLVCLIPTTIGALLPAIGIAGMDRLVRRNVLAMSGRAVEAAGDVSTLLLDKTGTITLGNRQADRVPHRPRGLRGGARRRRPVVQPGRRDPGGPLHRGAGQGALRIAGPGPGRGGAGALHRPDPDERGGSRGPEDPQGGHRRGAPLGGGAGGRGSRGGGRRGRRHRRRRRHSLCS